MNDLDLSRFDPQWQPALALSPWLQRRLATRPWLAEQLTAGWQQPLWGHQLSEALTDADRASDETIRVALRRLRDRVLAHLLLRDVAGLADLAEVTETMSAFADLAVQSALDVLEPALQASHGTPLNAEGLPQPLLVVGMGKLGGRELNVSSDIDLIFVYPEDGETSGREDGGGKIDNFDYFTRLGRRLNACLAEVTGDGQVFRVDMRLRPNGDSGPLVSSFDMLENYFITQGREWERYAWIKARICALSGGVAQAPLQVEAIGRLVRPFVFRRYLDYGAINAMRSLHAQIRMEVARRDRADHIKLGPGGIREIEFIAQVFQLIRGGRDAALRIRPTQEVLRILPSRQLLSREAVDSLLAAYDYLRRLEHRLQYVEDQQTHSLPTAPAEQAAIAAAMGHADWPALQKALSTHRDAVSRHFERVFSEPDDSSHPLAGVWLGQCDDDRCQHQLAALGFKDPDAAWRRLQQSRESSRYTLLMDQHRTRFDAVVPRLIEAASQAASPDDTLLRGLDFLEAIARRASYLALLQQYPQALSRVTQIIGSSRWAADYLTRHPLLLDELLDNRLLDTATDWPRFSSELSAQLAEFDDDPERQMDVLREMHHAQLFRLLAQDLAGLLTVEHLSDHLSELADRLVATTVDLCWRQLRRRHRDAPAFAVIAYGKLGGKEMGYSSDLDIVFVYDDADPDAQEIYARLAQRIITWLSSQTAAGIVFETDTRLRPNGDAGLLVTPIDAFGDYLEKNAWMWEIQALTRARFCAGDPQVGARFEAMRHDFLRQPRDAASLRGDVIAMRQKMLDAHGGKSEDFALKHDPGGLVDVEFAVQYLVLAHAHQHPELSENLGNIALLGRAGQLGLIPTDLAQRAADAYRDYRRLQHRLRLDGKDKAKIPPGTMTDAISAVRALWRLIFGDGSTSHAP